MRYFIEQQDWIDKPIIYNEKQLVEYAKRVYETYTEDDELINEYAQKDLSNTDTAFEFLRERFFYDDEPFIEACLYEDLGEKQ